MNSKKLITFIAIISTSAFSMPIDWTGSVGFDSHIIRDARGLTSSCTPNDDSQCVGDDQKDVRMQTTLLKLEPSIIVNDSTSIKGELSTGSSRGLFSGEDAGINNSGSYISSTQGGSELRVNQLYAELYADTAIYRVGKFARHFGLGAILNNGNQAWDRFFTAYNGIEAEFKLGNFSFIPSWSKLSSGAASNTASGKYDINDKSFELSYENDIKGMNIGLLYSSRDGNSSETLFNSTSGFSTTLIDIYFKKSWDKLDIAFEVPVLSGDVGKTYSTTNQDIDATAYIFESNYKLSEKWSLELNAGMVSGDAKNDDSYEAMYLNPNYQLANIMFRYNLHGFQQPNTNPLESSIRNTTYINLNTHYTTANWNWTIGFTMATAEQTANNGEGFYNHETKRYATATADQSDDLGYEVDLGFSYEWNPQIMVTGYIGYYAVGDYYSFTNTATEADTANILASGLGLSVSF
ncbi:MAG: hypothetical protein N4A33_08955 [Bacteriovoracaceae bacterium]|nr:hypothetical protein [Bacteriovoracaceae bacterium]